MFQKTLLGHVIPSKGPYYKNPLTSYQRFINSRWLKYRGHIRKEFIEEADKEWRIWGKAETSEATSSASCSTEHTSNSSVPTVKPYIIRQPQTSTSGIISETEEQNASTSSHNTLAITMDCEVMYSHSTSAVTVENATLGTSMPTGGSRTNSLREVSCSSQFQRP